MIQYRLLHKARVYCHGYTYKWQI
uniref:Uncharacterized protein n=1 Tax=Anguilla anguilla TaxID=7936 RepID=A0A0E9Q8S5_ANGAN